MRKISDFFKNLWVLLAAGFGRLLIRLPHRWQLALGRGLGRLLWRYSERSRYITDVNLQKAYPNMPAAERERLKRKSFESLGVGFFETLWAWWGDEQWVEPLLKEFTGIEHLEAALSKGQGVLLFIGHFTPLYLAGRFLSQRQTFNAMYSKPRSTVMDRLLYAGLAKHCEHIVKTNDLKSLLRCLKKNKVVWYAPDVDPGRKNGIFAAFMGVQACTVPMTGRLAKMTGAAVLPFHFKREADGHYSCAIQPALEDYPSGDMLQDTVRVNQCIEEMIAKNPEQYLWSYKRFKTRPEGEAKFYLKRRQRAALKY